MVARDFVLGRHHVAHHRRTESCELATESPLHLWIKQEVLDAARALHGWTADPEVMGQRAGQCGAHRPDARLRAG